MRNHPDDPANQMIRIMGIFLGFPLGCFGLTCILAFFVYGDWFNTLLPGLILSPIGFGMAAHAAFAPCDEEDGE